MLRGAWRSGARLETDTGTSRADCFEGPAGYLQRSVPANRNPARAAPMAMPCGRVGGAWTCIWGGWTGGNPRRPPTGHQTPYGAVCG